MKQLLNKREVSEIYGVSLAWLRKKRCTGDGPPYIKIDRMVRYRVQDLEQFFDSHLVLIEGGAE